MSDEDRSGPEDVLVEEGEVAGDYLETLLDILDYDGDIDLDVVRDRASVSIEGAEELGTLVGSDGEVLEALQELTRLAVQQELGVRSKLLLDIAGWRKARREALGAVGREAARAVLQSGESTTLDPMSPFERKIVHDAVADIEGVTSSSSGEEPHRRVIIDPE